jgi:hypothetical protein
MWKAATLEQQVASMRAIYPMLRLTVDGRWGCVWEGPLRGFDRPYTVRITYIVARSLGGCDVSWQTLSPRAQVLAPDILAECGGSRPPHVYGVSPHPDLCLYDPAEAEWRADMFLAESFVPWAAQWLAFYEIWRVTGRWTGPERHPESASAHVEVRTSADVIAVGSSRQAGHVADAAGTAASEPLLRAAAAKRIPSRCDWH